MKNIYILLLFFATNLAIAQVGINIEEPEATLDINGNLIIREVEELIDYPYEILVRNLVTNEVQSIPSENGGGNGSDLTASTYLKLVEKNDFQLYPEEEGFEGWQKINFETYSIEVDADNNYLPDQDVYVVPSAGTYQIIFELKFGTGMLTTAEDFSLSEPGMGVFSEKYGSLSELDTRIFSNSRFDFAPDNSMHTLVTNYTINSFYSFDEAEKISFAVKLGAIPEDFVLNKNVYVIIRKVSDYQKIYERKNVK